MREVSAGAWKKEAAARGVTKLVGIDDAGSTVSSSAFPPIQKFLHLVCVAVVASRLPGAAELPVLREINAALCRAVGSLV